MTDDEAVKIVIDIRDHRLDQRGYDALTLAASALETVARLPVTADGVRVAVNSSQCVYILVDGEVRTRASQVLIDTAARGWGTYETCVRPRTRGTLVDDEWIGMDRIFSTEAAARAAQGDE